jgi:3-phenylpropionate/trans-cinnamate dioxygenase ferredoxin component
MDPVRVGALVEIPEGEMRAYDVPAGRVAIAHDEQRLFAFDDVCTGGEACALSEGSFDDRTDQVTCSTCESVFDAETGEPLDGPARDPLKIHAVHEVDGWVEVSPYPVG